MILIMKKFCHGVINRLLGIILFYLEIFWIIHLVVS